MGARALSWLRSFAGQTLLGLWLGVSVGWLVPQILYGG